MTVLPRKRRIVIVDDHTLFREGLRTILETEEDIEVVADAESAEDIVELVWQTRPDVLLLDIRMPQGSGLDAVPAVLKISPNTHVLAPLRDEKGVARVPPGAKGVILKDLPARRRCRPSARPAAASVDDPRMSGALAEESHMGRRSDLTAGERPH